MKVKVKLKKQKCKCSLYHSAPVPGPLNLRAHDISTDSFQVNWDHSASDIVLYRLSWAPFSGGDTKEVSFNKIRSVTTVFLRCNFTNNNFHMHKRRNMTVFTQMNWSASKDELCAWTPDFWILPGVHLLSPEEEPPPALHVAR